MIPDSELNQRIVTLTCEELEDFVEQVDLFICFLVGCVAQFFHEVRWLFFKIGLCCQVGSANATSRCIDREQQGISRYLLSTGADVFAFISGRSGYLFRLF